jgi:hypothetical protein
MVVPCPWTGGGRRNDRTARNISATNRICLPVEIFKPVVRSKREEIEIPPGKHIALLSSELDQVGIDGEPDKSTGPAPTPGIVRGAYEFAKRQRLLPVIRFHNTKHTPGDRAAAIRCSPHAGLAGFRIRITAR